MDIKTSLLTILSKLSPGTIEYEFYSKKIKIILNDMDSISNFILEDLVKREWNEHEKFTFFGDHYTCFHDLKNNTIIDRNENITMYKKVDNSSISLYIKHNTLVNLDEMKSFKSLKEITIYTEALLYVNDNLSNYSRNIGECIEEANKLTKEYCLKRPEYLKEEESKIKLLLFEAYNGNTTDWKYTLQTHEKELRKLADIIWQENNLPKKLNIKISIKLST